MNAHIVSHGSNIYGSTITESGATKQYSKESTGFSDYLSGNLKSSNYYKDTDAIEKPIQSDKLVENKRTSSLNNKINTKKTNHNIEDKKADTTDNSKTAAEVDKISNQMKDAVKETLDIDDKELEQIMSQLGLNIQDLLIPDNLKLLCMEVSGESDILALLTNEDLSNKLAMLLDTLDGMNLSEIISEEELQNLLSKNGYANETTVIEEIQDSNVMTQEEQVPLHTDYDLIARDEQFPTTMNNDVKVVINKEGEPSLYHDTLVDEESSNDNQTQQEGNLNQESRLEMNQGNDRELVKSDSTKQPESEQFLNNLLQTTISNVEVVDGQVTTVTQIRDIVNQLVNEIRVNIKPDTTNMELQLNPEQLGKVNLSIVSKEGTVTAQFTVETSVAKEAIESQIHMLKENLTDQGVKVESIEVTVSNFSFGESNQTFESNSEQKQGHKPLKLDGFDDDMSGQDSNIIEELMQDYGNTVDYTA